MPAIGRIDGAPTVIGAHHPAWSEIGAPPEPGVSVIVPVFNSQDTLEDLVSRVSAVLGESGRRFEILLVNDGSADKSWEQIVEISRTNMAVRGIDLRRNYGQHNATLCGLRHARYTISITMDDDLQHPPSEIPKLLEQIDRGWDVVYGRAGQRFHSNIRDRMSTVTKAFVGRATGLRRVVEQSPFRAVRTEIRTAFDGYMGPDLLLDVLLGWGTERFCSVAVAHHARSRGRSHYTLKRLFDMGLLALTAYSTAPLRLASWIGLAMTVFGLGVLLYVILLRVFFGSIPGFPFLASLISIFGGAQLFTLGLFGEYLTRIFNRALGRPTYAIRMTTQGNSLDKTPCG